MHVARHSLVLLGIAVSSVSTAQMPGTLHVLGERKIGASLKRVVERRAADGALLGTTVAPGVASTHFGFGKDGLVYASGPAGSTGIWRYDPLTGKTLGQFTTSGGGDVAFSSAGALLFALDSGLVSAFDAHTGALVATSGYPSIRLLPGPAGDVYAISNDSSGAYIDRYSGATGFFVDSPIHEPIPFTYHGSTFHEFACAPNGDVYAWYSFGPPTFFSMRRYAAPTYAKVAHGMPPTSAFAIDAFGVFTQIANASAPGPTLTHWTTPSGPQLDSIVLPGLSSVLEIEFENELDCNGNGVADATDIASGASADCNRNGRPDECDIAFGSSLDLDGNLVPDECAELASSVASASISSQGAQPLALSSGPVHAGNVYLLLGSSSGTTPPLALDGLKLPLVPDAYFAFTLANPNQPPLAGSLGVLDAAGAAQATVQVPAGASATLAGLQLWHAFAVLALAPAPHAIATSNAVALVLVP